MRNHQIAVAVVIIETILLSLVLSGCGGTPVPVAPDLSPIGGGLTFIGLGIVLAAIIGLLNRK